MKRIAYLLLVILIATSCNNESKPQIEKELTNAEKEAIQLEQAEDDLKDSKEKIVLLSTIKGVHYDTLYSILKDYYYKLDGNSDNDTLVNSAILYTKEKHGFSKSKIASYIFSFKYEMLTKEEMMDNAIREHDEFYSESTENDY